MISAISGYASGPHQIDMAAVRQKLQQLYASRQQPAAATAPTFDHLRVDDLNPNERASVEHGGAYGFARRITDGGRRYVQRIWWG
jgi:maltoporin